MSPQGEWVRSHLKSAPPSVSLVELAVRWGGPPHHLRGTDLFAKLAEPAPGAAASVATDPPTLETLWWLVWGSGQPERAHFPRIIHICGAEAILAAGLGTRFLIWLTSPGRFDRELIDFAHAVHRRSGLGGRERATAQLIVLADDFARTGESPRDVVDRVGELRGDAPAVDALVWDGVQHLLARGFARLTPHDLYQSGALSYLANGEPALQHHYRAAVQAEFADEAALNRMADRPDAVADLFYVWRRDLTRSSRAWHATVEELLRGTLGVVLGRMNEEQRGAVATRLVRRSRDWLLTWQGWTDEMTRGGGRDTQIPGAPATYPPAHGQQPAPHVPGQPPPPKPGELPTVPQQYPPGYSPSHPPPYPPR